MKKILIILLLIIGFGLQSCNFSGDDRPQGDLYRVNVDTHLNIRDSPSKQGAIMGYIHDGALIEVLEVEDGWARIVYDDDATGYVSGEYLVLVKSYKNEEPKDEEEPSVTEYDEQQQNNPADNPANNATDGSSPEKGIAGGENVYFIGDSAILNDSEKKQISEALREAGEYVFIVNTKDRIATEAIFDYAPDLLDNLSEEMDSSMNWWQRFKSWFGGDSPSSNLVLISYIRDASLLQAECNGTSLKYLRMSEPNKYYKLQAAATHGLSSAIIDLGLAIDKAGAEYKARSWFVRAQINTGNIFENICEDWIVENILPNDSFLHKWILGWIFSLPFAFANWLFALTGSYLCTLLLIMATVLLLHFVAMKGIFRVRRLGTDKAGCTSALSILLLILNVFLWLSMLSLLVYMIPEMAVVSVMSKSGHSEKLLLTVINSFFNFSISKNWILVVLFLVGIILSKGLKADYALNATLPSRVQKTIYAKNRETIQNKALSSGEDIDIKQLDASDTPFLDLLIGSSGDEIGSALGPAIPLAFVFNGAFLLFASIFFWTKILKRLLYIGIGIISYRKQGLY